ncbi:MAG: tRNA (adenosine(37)-N6)-threonylcarbamoyltransferase complex ATPase subunit type 1 TsaE [Acidimicrobiales bacterium]
MSLPAVLDCPSLADTAAVAHRLAPLLVAGDVVLLDGELGAGKTAFTQALAEAVGVDRPITSPTFTLVAPYHTARGYDLLHVDLYRLEKTSEVAALGLAELLEEGAVAVIEWGARANPVLSPNHLSISFEVLPDGGRRLTLTGEGAGWPERLSAIAGVT